MKRAEYIPQIVPVFGTQEISLTRRNGSKFVDNPSAIESKLNKEARKNVARAGLLLVSSGVWASFIPGFIEAGIDGSIHHNLVTTISAFGLAGLTGFLTYNTGKYAVGDIHDTMDIDREVNAIHAFVASNPKS